MFNLHHLHSLLNLLVVLSSRVIKKIWKFNTFISLLCILSQCAYSYIGRDIDSWNCLYFVSEYVLGLSLLLNFFISGVYTTSEKVVESLSKEHLQFYRKLMIFTLIPYLLFKVIYTILFYQHISFVCCDSSRYYWGVIGAYIVLISLILVRVYHERE